MATYTEHYGLHQWESSDNFLRTDFNADFGIIDGALGDKAEMIVGSYTGNEAETRVIQLGVTPRAVLVESMDGERGAYCTGGLAVTGGPVQTSTTAALQAVAVVEGGFRVAFNVYYSETNQSGKIFRYMAFI